MPQITTGVGQNTATKALSPLPLDPVTGRQTIVQGGTMSALNITVPTVLKIGAGRVARVVVNTAGTTAGMISDAAATGGALAANLIANIPATAGTTEYDFPFAAGLLITPGTGQVLAVSFV